MNPVIYYFHIHQMLGSYIIFQRHLVIANTVLKVTISHSEHYKIILDIFLSYKQEKHEKYN